MAADQFNHPAREITVDFSTTPRKNLHNRAGSFAYEMASRVSLQSLRSAWAIGTRNDFSQRFLDAWNPGDYIVDLRTPAGTVYLTANPWVMRRVFENYRKSSEGIFFDKENTKLLLGVLKELYTEEIDSLGPQNAADMFVFTAAAHNVPSLRAPYGKLIGPSVISTQADTLIGIADGILTNLSASEMHECDAAQLSFEFAVTVISKLFTNYGTCREDYQKIAHALDIFSRRMSGKVLSKPPSAKEAEDYNAAKTTIKNLIQQCLSAPSPFVQGLIESEMNDLQCKVFLFGLYFAGTETTASVLNYLIWQLGRAENQAVQQAIRDPVKGKKAMEKSVAEAFRLHPPAFIMGRCLRENTTITVKDKSGNVVLEKELRRGHNVVCLAQAGGRDSTLYPDPERFNPDRFEDPRIPNLSFFPFGGGFHLCPGRHLAIAELMTLPDRLLHHYSMRTLAPEHPDQKGVFTLRAKPAKIQLYRT